MTEWEVTVLADPKRPFNAFLWRLGGRNSYTFTVEADDELVARARALARLPVADRARVVGIDVYVILKIVLNTNFGKGNTWILTNNSAGKYHEAKNT